MKEVWKPVPDYREYEVSSLGRVRSSRKGAPQLMSPAKIDGYMKVTIRNAKGKRMFFVHTLVLLAFKGARPSGKTACGHLNAKRDDNRPENLQWVSSLENNRMMIEHGTQPRGERMGTSKLRDQDVLFIRANYIPGNSRLGRPALAKKFKVSRASIDRILSGKYWRHLL